MKQVGLRELKNRLSEYVRAVRRGECVQATDRGQVVAEIIPRTTRAPGNLRDGLAALERRGLLEPPRVPGRARYAPQPRIARPGTAQRLIDAERGER
jgi:prevent-host-death family protein